MKRLRISEPDIMHIAIRNEIQRSEEARYDHRLHGVLLVCRGLSCYQVADLLGQHPTTIQRWVRTFETHGFSGLYDRERSGRPRRLTPKQMQTIGHDLRKAPRDLGYTQNMWDGTLLSHHLQHRYGVKLGIRQCQRLFRHLGFRLRKPRPLIAHADPDEQLTFKKTPSTGTKKRH